MCVCTRTAHEGAEAFILSGNRAAFNALHMKPSSKLMITVGGVETRLHRYHVLPPKSVNEAGEEGGPGSE